MLQQEQAFQLLDRQRENELVLVSALSLGLVLALVSALSLGLVLAWVMVLSLGLALVLAMELSLEYRF